MIGQQGLEGHGRKRPVGIVRGSSEILSCQLGGSGGAAGEEGNGECLDKTCCCLGGQLRKTTRNNYGAEVSSHLTDLAVAVRGKNW